MFGIARKVPLVTTISLSYSDPMFPLGSTFLQNTLGNGYPRLLRLFHEFFAKIAVHTDTIYVSTYQR